MSFGSEYHLAAGADGSVFFEPQRRQCASRKELYYGDESSAEVVTIDQAKGRCGR